jgi:hypothetical protein
LRHRGFHRIKDQIDLTPHIGDFVARVALVKDGLQLLGRPWSGVDFSASSSTRLRTVIALNDSDRRRISDWRSRRSRPDRPTMTNEWGR